MNSEFLLLGTEKPRVRPVQDLGGDETVRGPLGLGAHFPANFGPYLHARGGHQTVKHMFLY